MDIVQEFRDLARFEQIMLILIEEDFGHLLVDTKVINSLSWFDHILLRMARQRAAPEVRLARMLEKLGPTFVKFGQLLSVRPDVLPPHYIKTLEKLQAEVSPIAFEEVVKVVEAELNKPWRKVFRSIDPQPLASASVAQVHKAVLRSGRKVIIKVQRPKVKELFATDIHIMRTFADLLEKHKPYYKRYKISKLVNEFERWTQEEVDFRNEAANQEAFYKIYKGHPFLHIPRLEKNYCTQHMLVMEYIAGIPLSQVPNHPGYLKNCTLSDIFSKAFSLSLEQIFVHGIWHADPHPGNILVERNGKMALIDYGIVGHIDANLQRLMFNLFSAVIENDPDQIMDTIAEMTTTQPSPEKLKDLRLAVTEVINAIHGGDFNKKGFGQNFERLLHCIIEGGVNIPKEFVLFAKSLVTIEGIAMRYDPHFNVVGTSRPYIEKLIKQQLRSAYSMKSIAKKVVDSGLTALGLPQQASKVLQRIESGEIKLQIQDTDIKRLAIEIDRSSNRIAYATIIAAFVIAAAMLMTVKDFALSPTSVLAFILFALAGILGLVLFVSIKDERSE